MNNDYLQQIKSFEDEINQIYAELADKIMSLPDNPRINRMAGNAFTINLSDTDNVLSAQYHDFKYQYQKLAEFLLRNKDVDGLINLLKKGRFSDGSRIHPDVIKSVKSLVLGENFN